jgi:hypothetical protein
MRRWMVELEADVLLVVELLLCLTLWGPQIVVWLSAAGWVGDRLAVTGAAAATACLGLAASASATLGLARRVDHARARLRAVTGKPADDVLAATIVALTVVTGAAMAVWFLFVQGPGPLLIRG